MGVVATVGASTGLHIGLVVTALGLGFRHGIDWDHIAALTDITGSQERSRQSLLLATMYALGHAVVVFALGVAAIGLSAEIPHWLDDAMGRIVGVTLLALGVYVFVSLARHGRDFRMRSRWMLVFATARRTARWVTDRRARTPIVLEIDRDHSHGAHHHDDHSHGPGATHDAAPRASSATMTVAAQCHPHRHVGVMPDDPFPTYGRRTAFAIGALHGIGAETPTQILVFLAAARAGGTAIGITLLVCFIVGLLASNTVVALAAAFGFVGARQHFGAYATVSIAAATASLAVGTLFLAGQTTLLPALTGA